MNTRDLCRMYADAVSYMIVDEHYIIHCGMCRLRRMLMLFLL
jgi:hypothetical protein